MERDFILCLPVSKGHVDTPLPPLRGGFRLCSCAHTHTHTHTCVRTHTESVLHKHFIYFLSEPSPQPFGVGMIVITPIAQKGKQRL